MDKAKDNSKFPSVFDRQKYSGLCFGLKQCAECFVKQFTGSIIPILKRFRMCDDDHIRKYLTAPTFETIYADLKDNPQTKYLISFMEETNDDFWAPFRKNGARRPDESDEDFALRARPGSPGFEFCDMPFTQVSGASEFVGCIKVDGCKLSIDYGHLKSLCYVQPSQKQQAAYELAKTFVEGLVALGVTKKSRIDPFFTYDKNGNILVSPEGILWGHGRLI
ncbi:MAG: hypothetical protein IKH88_02255 [Prevotella sp.]|nr:hypothetical protein [Prevotella sp.]